MKNPLVKKAKLLSDREKKIEKWRKDLEECEASNIRVEEQYMMAKEHNNSIIELAKRRINELENASD